MSQLIRAVVLEDVAADAELIVYELKQAGFRTEWQRVDNRSDYLAAVATIPDVILADFSLPQYNALAALHDLQALNLDIPFIVVTASVSEEVAVECMRQGAADYLLKDRLSRLGPAVESALAAKATRDQKRRAEEQLLQAKRDLEIRVEERTRELIAANDRLTVELTERLRAEGSLRFLAEAGKTLSSSLDYQTTLANVVHLAVPHLADWCAVDVVGDDGQLRRLAVAHVDPEKEALARDIQGCFPFVPNPHYGVASVLATGKPQLYPDVPDLLLVELATNDDDLEACRRLGITSAMIVPLIARDRTLGVVAFVSAQENRRYSQADLNLAMELARRAAQAVDNAHLYLQAQQAITIRDQFLSSVSHDLKTPLAAMKGTAQLLLRLLKTRAMEVDPRIIQGLATIDARATKMNAQINDLLDVARLQVGQTLDLQRAPTDLVALARSAVSDCQQASSRHSVTLESTHERIIGQWDATRVERAVGNLLSNAVKFSPGGGAIKVAMCVECEGEDEHAVLSVEDEGIGIPEAEVRTVFERFKRGSNVAPYISGTGVGLASARQIVEQHGGTIALTSVEGKGSTFTIRLPINPPPVA